MTTLGLFRWDPLTGTGTTTGIGDMGADNRAWLGPSQFHFRIPFFMSLGNPAVGRSDTQTACDMQIQMAYAAGFDYFAYALQPDQEDFFTGGGSDPRSDWIDANAALRLHRSSSYKTLVKWCMNVVMDRGAGTAVYRDGGTWQVVADYIIAAMQDSGYMTVLSGRPLLFLYAADDFVTYSAGNTTNALNSFNYIRTAVQSAIGKDPYMVTLGTSTGPTHTTATGMNAGGRYSVLAVDDGESYATFAARMEATWATDAGNYSEIVPNCSMGIDYSPSFTTQIENSYSPPGVMGSEGEPGPLCVAPTYAEAATHIGNAISYVGAHSSKCPTDTVCIYNWSEPTECGAGLWPTHGDYGNRVQAIGAALGRTRSTFFLTKAADGTLAFATPATWHGAAARWA